MPASTQARMAELYVRAVSRIPSPTASSRSFSVAPERPPARAQQEMALVYANMFPPSSEPFSRRSKRTARRQSAPQFFIFFVSQYPADEGRG